MKNIIENVEQKNIANPKISVVIPSLNVKEYIRECIESVIYQTLKDIEINMCRFRIN